MDSLRVSNGIKRIEVNDNGEYIEIPISDTAFFERYAEILQYFDKKQIDIEQQAKEISEKYLTKEQEEKPDEDTISEMNVNMVADMVKLYSELCKDVCIQLDKLFGDGCCQKVFLGIEAPGIELIGDFFEQITPFLQKYAQERNDKISLRYNNRRKGARSR